jgi:ligand-binding sensor domain-containing protein
VELDGTNLKDPANWHISTIPAGSNEMTRMISNGDKVYVALDDGIYHYDFLNFTEVFLANSAIFDLRVASGIPDRFVYTTSSGIYEYNISSGLGTLLEGLGGITHIALDGDEIWVASSIDYFGLLANESYETFSANRPRDHQFNRIVINSEGQLVGAAKNGISIHSELGWRTVRPGDQASSFNVDLYDWNTMIVDTLAYKGNAIVEDIITDGEGNLFFSLQGKGVLRTDENLLGEGKYYNADDDILEATYDSQTKTFILPGQMAVDSENNVWVTTKLIKEGGSSLTILGSDGEAYHVQHDQDGLDSRSVKSITIDQNDHVWTGSQVWEPIQATGGIHFIDHGGILTSDMELNVSLLSTSNSPLASNDILQLEVDAQNTLWILTTSGVQSMTLPDRWLNSLEIKSWANLYMTSKTADDYYYWQLTDYNVTAIEIDQRGNRWFLSSNSGVHALQSTGRWINNGFGYNTGNSELLDNQIYSVAFDAASGQTYFSTQKGISVLNTPFADPKDDYSEMHIYPQPFDPNIHDKVVIQGLMDNSSVKILTISGSMVRELSSSTNEVQGYEAQWDGRDSQGDIVGSGVYILYIYNEDGVSSSQKLAVLR